MEKPKTIMVLFDLFQCEYFLSFLLFSLTKLMVVELGFGCLDILMRQYQQTKDDYRNLHVYDTLKQFDFDRVDSAAVMCKSYTLT